MWNVRMERLSCGPSRRWSASVQSLLFFMLEKYSCCDKMRNSHMEHKCT
jgi:hypothetical protein